MMSEQELGREKITRNLHEAIERLHEDIARIEIWTSALGCFSQPIPDYKPSNDFALPPARRGGGNETYESSQRVYR